MCGFVKKKIPKIRHKVARQNLNSVLFHVAARQFYRKKIYRKGFIKKIQLRQCRFGQLWKKSHFFLLFSITLRSACSKFDADHKLSEENLVLSNLSVCCLHVYQWFVSLWCCVFSTGQHIDRCISDSIRIKHFFFSIFSSQRFLSLSINIKSSCRILRR